MGLLIPALMNSAHSAVELGFADGESLRVVGSNVILREGPYRGAPVVGTLNEYDHVLFTGEYTVEPVTVSIRGESITAPYISVRADSGAEGWVFGGLVTADSDVALLAGKLQLLSVGDGRQEVIRLYGRDYVTHDRRMRSETTQNLLDRLGVDQAWEYYYFRSGEGVVFGFGGSGDRIASQLVRQDVFD
ncbi:MAG: hypothetical protein WED11_08650, partial [Natronospirillum sp.]